MRQYFILVSNLFLFEENTVTKINKQQTIKYSKNSCITALYFFSENKGANNREYQKYVCIPQYFGNYVQWKI